MGCQYYDPCQNGATSFTVAMPRLTFGRGCLSELGFRAAALGFKRTAIITDPGLRDGPIVAQAVEFLGRSQIDVAIFSDIRIEPTDKCAEDAARFLRDGKFDSVVSIGGGSALSLIHI